MGTYKSKYIKNDFTNLDPLPRQKNYKPTTRPPNPDLKWAKNILRGKREDDLKDQAMLIARRKCKYQVLDYYKCLQSQGMFWAPFNCQQTFHYLEQCLSEQLIVQMDKRRRDMKRNPQSWWRQYYTSEGEHGKQAQWKQQQGLFQRLNLFKQKQ